jgi:hypothetical protein
LRYAEFVVPLVKAVQELSVQNEELKTQNAQLLLYLNQLDARNAEFRIRIEALETRSAPHDKIREP